MIKEEERKRKEEEERIRKEVKEWKIHFLVETLHKEYESNVHYLVLTFDQGRREKTS